MKQIMYRVTNIAWLKIPTGGRQISWLFTKWSEWDLDLWPLDYKADPLGT